MLRRNKKKIDYFQSQQKVFGQLELRVSVGLSYDGTASRVRRTVFYRQHGLVRLTVVYQSVHFEIYSKYRTLIIKWNGDASTAGRSVANKNLSEARTERLKTVWSPPPASSFPFQPQQYRVKYFVKDTPRLTEGLAPRPKCFIRR